MLEKTTKLRNKDSGFFMHLISFQKDKKKQPIIIVFSIGLVLLIAGIIFYRTYSLFEETEEYDVIKGSVPEYFDSYDIKINFKVDGVSVNQAPTREDKKGVESITCDKGAMGSWDYYHWNFNVGSLSQTKTTCTVNFVTRYTEDILNGTDPVLKDELIPVTIDHDGVVHKANIQEKWYEYGKQQWANAVILENESTVYQNGEEIPESNIESYFVWIPRYQYKLFDMGNYEGLTTIENKPQIIDVQFGLETTVDSDSSCKTPMESGESGNCSVGKYMTHPAFISFESIGMWVGKFETGYKGATQASEAEQNVNDASKVQIKPNVYSWRGIQVANAYLNSYNYKRNLDSHMMKNTEWGAVAYLQHSAYGSHKNVRHNSNYNFLTGYGATIEPTIGHTQSGCIVCGNDSSVTQPWNTSVGFLASTTGNISGIYDISGGADELVMAIMFTRDGLLPLEASFLRNSKYYDIYTYGESQLSFIRRILGDATGEMGPFHSPLLGDSYSNSSWYDDVGNFSHSAYFGLSRGSNLTWDNNTGVFAFHFCDFQGSYMKGFRIVLII